jgi:hypothetical protein
MFNREKKILILLFGSYLLAFVMNFMPSIKAPDLNVTIVNLVVSILFAVVLLIYSKTGSKKLRLFSLVGVISGIIIYLINVFEYEMMGNFLLDSLASLQYPLYVIYTTPIFGGAIFFELNYQTYSLFLSVFYATVLVLTLKSDKKV